MPQARDSRRMTETVAGIIILLALGVIAAGVFLSQFRFNEAVLVSIGSVRGSGLVPSSDDSLPDFGVYYGDEVIPLSDPEIFGRDNLSDKIDGKAELYLSAGFVALRCQWLVLS